LPSEPGEPGLGAAVLIFGLVIFAVVGVLGWIAFRKREPSPPGRAKP